MSKRQRDTANAHAVTLTGAYIAPVKTGIMFDGSGGGGQVRIDFPEIAADDARKLLALRMSTLRITFEIED